MRVNLRKIPGAPKREAPEYAKKFMQSQQAAAKQLSKRQAPAKSQPAVSKQLAELGAGLRPPKK